MVLFAGEYALKGLDPVAFAVSRAGNSREGASVLSVLEQRQGKP